MRVAGKKQLTKRKAQPPAAIPQSWNVFGAGKRGAAVSAARLTSPRSFAILGKTDMQEDKERGYLYKKTASEMKDRRTGKLSKA